MMDEFGDLRNMSGIEFERILLRHNNCEYSLPEETYTFFSHFQLRYWEAKSGKYWDLWSEPQHIGSFPSRKPNPKLFTAEWQPSAEYADASQLREWIRLAVPQLQQIAHCYGVDYRPLLWFSRAVMSGEALSAGDCRAVDDFFEQVGFHLGIVNGVVNSERAAAVHRGESAGDESDCDEASSQNSVPEVDETACVEFNKLNWREHFDSDKRALAFLDKNEGTIRQIRKRRRRLVHAADWIRHWQSVASSDFLSLAGDDEPDERTTMEIEKRRQQVRRNGLSK